MQPANPDYAYTLDYFLYQGGDSDTAIQSLQGVVGRKIAHASSYTMLGSIYLEKGQTDKALETYRSAKENMALSEAERKRFEQIIQSLSQKQ